MEMYIVVENGGAYRTAYKTYASAVASVKRIHKEVLESQIKEVGKLELIETILADVNVQEDPEGLTRLYIEKGIMIAIYKVMLE
jgi:hypothetical protein